MSSANDLRAALLAVCDWYEEEYGIGFEDSEYTREDVESADEDALWDWWSRITWQVGVNRADGSPAAEPEARDALTSLYPGGELDLVDEGVFGAILPPGLALDLIREGHVEIKVGGLSITAETP